MNECKNSSHQKHLCLAIQEANRAAFNLPTGRGIWEPDLHALPGNISSKEFAEVLPELAVLRVDSGFARGCVREENWTTSLSAFQLLNQQHVCNTRHPFLNPGLMSKKCNGNHTSCRLLCGTRLKVGFAVAAESNRSTTRLFTTCSRGWRGDSAR